MAGRLIAALLNALNDDSADVRFQSAMALTSLVPFAAPDEMDEVVLAILTPYKDTDMFFLMRSVMPQLTESAGADFLVPILLKLIRHENVYVRSMAQTEFEYLGEYTPTTEVITTVLNLLNDNDNWVRESAAITLGKLGRVAGREAVVVALLKHLKDEDERVRAYSAGALGSLGEAAARDDVMAALLDLLKRGESYGYALSGLVRLRPSDDVMSSLVQILDDDNAQVRESCAVALGEMGEPAARTDILEKLASLVRDGDDKGQCMLTALQTLLPYYKADV